MSRAPLDGDAVQVTVRLRGIVDTLQPSLARVARVILAGPASVADLSISDLARRARTSETTVIRLCRRLDVGGYPQLRLQLAKEAGSRERGGERHLTGDIDPDDTLREVVEKLAFADARAVEDTASSISLATLDEVVAAIVAAERVDIFGVGASGFVAMDLQQKLHRIGCIAFSWSDAHLSMTSAALLSSRDVAIGISHTGATFDTIDPLELARATGATTIAITNSPDSPLVGHADLVLLTAARETTFRSGATASRIAQLAVIDFIFVGVAQRRFEQSRHAIEVTAEAVRNRRTGRVRPQDPLE